MSNDETQWFAEVEKSNENDPELIARILGSEIGEAIAKAMKDQGVTYDAPTFPPRLHDFMATPEKYSIVNIVRLAHAVGLKLTVNLEPIDDSS